ncbi:hypothetical protein GCM10012275_55150 [Longimycelium tulufanense]|uniref:Uncharacterized protein n=1 Tax=Longimycelium tulufanense TaxID=907463 RepID=A0A8J3CJM2_9PSEU|nr:hypothetical protein [Longimycelium tulufanense]GGM77427.1 hypothetical protein GCM10012275_55150 [Longimycelium tulufanense]
MTCTIDLCDARAVLDFLRSHPDLPGIASLDHNGYANPRDQRAHHTIQLADRSIRAALAWHEVLTDVRIVLDDYNETGSVHIGLYGLLHTGPGVHVYTAVRGDERTLVRLNTNVTANAHGRRVEVDLLRRLVDAHAAERRVA